VPEVCRLLSLGADVNASKDNYGWKHLHCACSKGHVQVIKELLEHGADMEAKDNDDRTPLHWACGCDHLLAVNELLSPNESRGADMEAKARNGLTPLHFASMYGRVAIVRTLLSCGANILAVNNGGRLPIHEAVNRGKSEVAKYLLLHFYATIRRLPLHELLKDLTWFVDRNSNDAPPLCFALDINVLGTNDVVEMVEYLVGQNPELLSSRDQDGSLPLHVACRRGASFPIVQSLVNHYKASVKSRTPQGDLPLFLACEISKPSLDTIFILVKLYPDLVHR
jgi:ankyrin repeat protein